MKAFLLIGQSLQSAKNQKFTKSYFSCQFPGRKKGGGSNSNQNVAISTGGGGGGGSVHFPSYVYEGYDEDDDDDDSGGGGGGKGKRKRKNKRQKRKNKRKGNKKWVKHIMPAGIGIMALKCLLLHFIIKKLALATAFSLLLGKASFVLSSVIALKQLFAHHTGKSESSKLEVVHIPIKHNIHKKNHETSPPNESYHDNSGKFIPLTYAGDDNYYADSQNYAVYEEPDHPLDHLFTSSNQQDQQMAPDNSHYYTSNFKNRRNAKF